MTETELTKEEIFGLRDYLQLTIDDFCADVGINRSTYYRMQGGQKINKKVSLLVQYKYGKVLTKIEDSKKKLP